MAVFFRTATRRGRARAGAPRAGGTRRPRRRGDTARSSSTPRAEPVADARDEFFRGGGARGHAHGLDTVQPVLADVGLVVDQVRRDAVRAGDLDEPVRSTSCASRSRAGARSRRASPSPPTAGWRSRSRCPRASERGSREAPAEHLDHHRSRRPRGRLRDVGELGVGPGVERLGVLDGLDQDRGLRRLAHRPLDLLAGVADEDDGVALGGVALGLDVTFVTRGQVASIVFSPRAAAFAWTTGATPWAEKTIVEPSGASCSLSTKIAPRSSSSRTTWALWTICFRT